ncbi:hypothetical protein HMPREF1634_07765 [Tissierellia bacterium S7-1-4]|nr:hypothetical protein HMPREF1634_07765 [Tissierellia bacterium S7-1-4]
MAFTPYIDIYPEKSVFRILFEIFLREGVEGFGGGLWWRVFLGEIFYRHNVVGGGVNCTNDIYGGTLPVLKNEI